MSRKKSKQRKENVIKINLKKRDGVDWIKLAVHMDDWRGHKKMETNNLCFPFKLEIFLIVSATTIF
jgi:hypothetical protein